ncbi:MAG: YhcH/YjgK/YiaL family protein [Clostridia bacterium]|nr:YhcH/YjgK/YiaL family protein [Clostridia bacterium]
MIKITDFNKLNDYFNVPGEALEFLCSINMDTECKRYDFSDDCYINVQSVQTKPETPLMEAHVKFVDIQCLINGEEKIYYTEKEGLPIIKEYNEDGDAALYSFNEKSDAVTYKSGEAIILYPCEAHLPNRTVNEPVQIKKAILKIALTLAK